MDERRLRHLSEIYKLFSNPTRLAVVNYLAEGERSVADIAERLHISTGTLAQHLGRLRRLKIIDVRRDGIQAYYRISDTDVVSFCKAVEEFYRRHFKA